MHFWFNRLGQLGWMVRSPGREVLSGKLSFACWGQGPREALALTENIWLVTQSSEFLNTDDRLQLFEGH